MLTLPDEYREVVSLFIRCRSGAGGLACLPDAGGVNDQCAWLMDAFEIVEAAFEKMRPQR